VVQPAVSYEFQPVSLALASQFHGKRARLTTKAGELKEGVLRDSHADSVVMEIPFQGGVAAFEFPFSDIERLSVYEARGAVAALTPPEPAPVGPQAQEMPSGEVQVAQPEAPAPVEAQAAQPLMSAPIAVPPAVALPAGQVAGQPGAAAPKPPQGEGVAAPSGAVPEGVSAPVPTQELPSITPQAPPDPGQTGAAPPAREILEEPPLPVEPAAGMGSASVQTSGGAEPAPQAVSNALEITGPGLPKP
jgi:hypothetical protein